MSPSRQFFGGRQGRGRLATIGAAAAGLLLVGVGGSLLPAQSAPAGTSAGPEVGRTTTTCPTARTAGATQTVTAAALRQAPNRTGELTGTPVGGTNANPAATLRLSDQGRATQIDAPATPMILAGEGVMASAASGMSFSTATTGELAGLMAVGCGAPATQHWFVGVGASAANRTELVLTNPDDGQAEVDLRFYGRNGLIVVPGSPGLVVDGHGTRTIALSSLVNYADPLTVAVRASEGRVSAVALNRVSTDLNPIGADWQPGSAAPALTQVVPAIPEGAGSRRLMVANPGQDPATVSVSLLGIEGAFAPAGAESVTVAPESTAVVDLAAGLAGQPASVQLSSDQPITAAVVAASSRAASQPDVATQPAAAPIGGVGIVPLAQIDKVDSELALSNGGDDDVALTFEVVSFEGVTLRQDNVLLVGHATATRRLTSPSPAYLVVRVPAGANVYGGLTLTQQGGTVAGLATVQVTSPDLASRAPDTRFDPGVGRG